MGYYSNRKTLTERYAFTRYDGDGWKECVYNGSIGDLLFSLLLFDFSALIEYLEKKKAEYKKIYPRAYSKRSELIHKDRNKILEEIMSNKIIGSHPIFELIKYFFIDYIDDIPDSLNSVLNCISATKSYVDKSINNDFYSQYDIFHLTCQMGYLPLPETYKYGYAAVSCPVFNGFNPTVDFSKIEAMVSELSKTDEIVYEYSISNYGDFIGALLNEIYILGIGIKHCENCNKYFIPFSRSDAIYCDRISPQDNTLSCKEYGTQRLWYDRIKQDEALKLCRTIYAKKQMISRRNPDIKEYQSAFELFKSESAHWKKEYKSGLKSSEEFIVWLKAEKEKKV